MGFDEQCHGKQIRRSARAKTPSDEALVHGSRASFLFETRVAREALVETYATRLLQRIHYDLSLD